MIIDIPIEFIINVIGFLFYTILILFVGYFIGIYTLSKRIMIALSGTEITSENYIEFANQFIKMTESVNNNDTP